MLALVLGTCSLVLWLIIAGLPWRPWSTREHLDSNVELSIDLSDITILIPARNEAEVIATTLTSLVSQANDCKIVLVDDQSSDATRELAESIASDNLIVIKGKPTEPGWSGKLYALEQGRKHIKSNYILLLDADIKLMPGTLATLKQKMQEDDLALLSMMAELKMQTFWEKLLMPAFIYFFKLLYPFALSNQKHSPIAAAAGGCILVRTEALNKIGGFSAIKDTLIDDCSLAKAIKNQGYAIWTGLTHSAISLRSYHDLSSIWLMVTRTAFTQLKHSYLLLLACIGLMSLAYIIPVIGILSFADVSRLLCLLSLLTMFLLYLPTLYYYRISPLWCLSIPLAALLYLFMTCDSAIKHSLGSGAEWKGRKYQ